MSGDASPIQGNPMLLYTPQYPGYASSRTYLEAMPGYVAYVFAHSDTFTLRWVKDLVGYLVDFAAGLGPIAIGLAMAGLLLREARGRYRELKPLSLFFVAIALQIAAFAALQRSPRFLVPVVPLACVALGVAAAPALDRFSGRRMVILLFVLLIGERAATVGFETRSALRRYPPLPAALVVALRERATEWPRDQLLLTDIPDWSVWHLDRPALLLPTWRSMTAVMKDHPSPERGRWRFDLDRDLGPRGTAARIQRADPAPGRRETLRALVPSARACDLARRFAFRRNVRTQ